METDDGEGIEISKAAFLIDGMRQVAKNILIASGVIFLGIIGLRIGGYTVEFGGGASDRGTASREARIADTIEPTRNATATHDRRPAGLELREGQPYAEVRDVLLAEGYEPVLSEVSGQCWPWDYGDGEHCYDRPEIHQCSGTGMGYCAAAWYRGDETISVTIAEGPDGTFVSASRSVTTELPL